MTLQEFIDSSGVRPSDLAPEVRCSKSYLSHVMAQRKPLSRRIAIAIWRKHGVKLGPIANASDEDIDALSRFEAVA